MLGKRFSISAFWLVLIVLNVQGTAVASTGEDKPQEARHGGENGSPDYSIPPQQLDFERLSSDERSQEELFGSIDSSIASLEELVGVSAASYLKNAEENLKAIDVLLDQLDAEASNSPERAQSLSDFRSKLELKRETLLKAREDKLSPTGEGNSGRRNTPPATAPTEKKEEKSARAALKPDDLPADLKKGLTSARNLGEQREQFERQRRSFQSAGPEAREKLAEAYSELERGNTKEALSAVNDRLKQLSSLRQAAKDSGDKDQLKEIKTQRDELQSLKTDLKEREKFYRNPEKFVERESSAQPSTPTPNSAPQTPTPQVAVTQNTVTPTRSPRDAAVAETITVGGTNYTLDYAQSTFKPGSTGDDSKLYYSDSRGNKIISSLDSSNGDWSLRQFSDNQRIDTNTISFSSQGALVSSIPTGYQGSYRPNEGIGKRVSLAQESTQAPAGQTQVQGQLPPQGPTVLTPQPLRPASTEAPARPRARVQTTTRPRRNIQDLLYRPDLSI